MLDVVKEYTDLDYAYYSDPNRVVIRNEWDGVEQATVQSDTAQVRQKGGIKSLILADVQKGDTLLYLENLDNWCKVMTADGYTGYIQTEDISEPEVPSKRGRQRKIPMKELHGITKSIWSGIRAHRPSRTTRWQR